MTRESNERYELNKQLAQMLKGGVIMDVGSLTLAIKEKRCEASKMAYFFVNFSIFFLSNV